MQLRKLARARLALQRLARECLEIRSLMPPIPDFNNLPDCYNQKAPARSWLRGAAHRPSIRPGSKVARNHGGGIDRRVRGRDVSATRNPSIFLRGFFPVRLLTWDRKPATSMALLTRGLEALGQPAAPPLSNESTRWLDQCRCCKFQSFLMTLSAQGSAIDGSWLLRPSARLHEAWRFNARGIYVVRKVERPTGRGERMRVPCREQNCRDETVKLRDVPPRFILLVNFLRYCRHPRLLYTDGLYGKTLLRVSVASRIKSDRMTSICSTIHSGEKRRISAKLHVAQTKWRSLKSEVWSLTRGNFPRR